MLDATKTIIANAHRDSKQRCDIYRDVAGMLSEKIGRVLTAAIPSKDQRSAVLDIVNEIINEQRDELERMDVELLAYFNQSVASSMNEVGEFAMCDRSKSAVVPAPATTGSVEKVFIPFTTANPGSVAPLGAGIASLTMDDLGVTNIG